MNIKFNEEKVAAIGKFKTKQRGKRNVAIKNEKNQRRLARNRAEKSQSE